MAKPSYNVKLVTAFWRGFDIPAPVTEHRFHPQRKWRFDFAWPESRVAVEVQGCIFGKGRRCPVCKQRTAGRHTRGPALVKEYEKQIHAAILGWRILPLTPQQLLKTEFARLLAAALG